MAAVAYGYILYIPEFKFIGIAYIIDVLFTGGGAPVTTKAAPPADFYGPPDGSHSARIGGAFLPA